MPKSDIEHLNITLAKSLTYNNLKQKVISKSKSTNSKLITNNSSVSH